MSDSNQRRQERNESDWTRLAALFDAAAARDRAAFESVLVQHPELAPEYAGLFGAYAGLRSALAEDAASIVGSAFESIAGQARADARAIHAADTTVITRALSRLAPEQALQLYREIAPDLALGILRHLDRGARLDTVQRVSEHLSHPDTLERLRGHAHVRDGILVEVSAVLNDAGVLAELDREKLLRIIERSGVLNKLTIMENCIAAFRRVA